MFAQSIWTPDSFEKQTIGGFDSFTSQSIDDEDTKMINEPESDEDNEESDEMEAQQEESPNKIHKFMPLATGLLIFYLIYKQSWS